MMMLLLQLVCLNVFQLMFLLVRLVLWWLKLIVDHEVRQMHDEEQPRKILIHTNMKSFKLNKPF
jgi:hypothetical protein